MASDLYTKTISKTLHSTLKKLMQMPVLKNFRLVGGSALSLQLGHRISVDLDLFTDELYGSIDFNAIQKELSKEFGVLQSTSKVGIGPGFTCFIGESEDNLIKLDLFYTEKFQFPNLIVDNIRIADIRDIAAMKLEVISNNGRKKDFWDLIEILEHFTFKDLIEIYRQKYPYNDIQMVIKGLIDFRNADNEVEPICLKGRYWELIKADITDLVQEFKGKV
jgi:hypothetical protein